MRDNQRYGYKYWYLCEKHFVDYNYPNQFAFMVRPFDAVCDICGEKAMHFGPKGEPANAADIQLTPLRNTVGDRMSERMSNLVKATPSHPLEEVERLEAALMMTYGKETCYPDEREGWSNQNPAWGQCAVAALVVNTYLGGEILYDPKNIHFWNRVEGIELDMSREQFPEGTELKWERVRTPEDMLTGERAEKAETKKRFDNLLWRVSVALGVIY